MNNIILRKKNICLRQITKQDTDMIVKWRNSDFVRKNFLYQNEFTPELHNNWLETQVETGHVIQFIIEYLVNNKKNPVGSVYLRDIDTENSSAEFGIFIGEADFLGKKIGTESTKLILDFAHKELGLHRVFLRLISDNIAAYKTYRKAGFITEGIFRDMKKINGNYIDIMFMSSIK